MTPTEIIKAVSAQMDVPAELIWARTRKREIVEARSVCSYLMTRQGMTSKQVAWEIRRERSTISNQLQMVRDLMDTDSGFRATVEELCRQAPPVRAVLHLPAGAGRWE